MSRKWYEILGYVGHPMFLHFSLDRWVQDLGEEIDRFFYLKDVIVEHLEAGKVKGVSMDRTYLALHRENNAVAARDKTVYNIAKRYMKMDAMMLRAHMIEGPDIDKREGSMNLKEVKFHKSL